MVAPSSAPTPALALSTLIAAALAAMAWWLAARPDDGRALAFSVVAGALFGLVLQRSRFCFYCNARDFLERRDARGLIGIVVALIVGTIGYHAVFGAFLPIARAPGLPPGAHIGPVSWVLAAGALAFGLGTALSGSCISAHLYRLGEGAVGSVFALLGAVAGFALGFASWNTLYLSTIQAAPVVWLPHFLGYGGSLLVQVGLLVSAVAWLLRHHRRQADQTGAELAGLNQVPRLGALLFGARWPSYVGGLLVAAIGVVAYFRVAPLGVTAELGSLARTAAASQGWLPDRLEGLDSFAGCATVVKDALLSRNGVFVIGLVLASFASALIAGDFRPKWPSASESLRALGGGLLMGWGAMVALGCTVGTLLSGIMAGAVSGWVFAVVGGLGLVAGWWVRRRFS
ncbi:YeeE/YedE family protein [Pigmentiphaga aceris]|uniref:YeeE/YedE family protein n=1 Tax=Pigmentiphaga aceris TaxID=1940612 RepID=A0A5C0B9B9_9BURK|nr:YeeE/YedE family protein [Pigmentiphaga aceris]